ncbi:MAG: nucleoside-diphosphate kinase [Patescibacteria group bacterium]|nr:nucleoside-diphosphate kinase [Patescibacteria group bacterium]
MKGKYLERTLVLIKPDGVERKLVGEIIGRFERAGLKIIGLGVVRAKRSTLEKHYPNKKDWVENLGNNLLKTAQEFNIKVDLKKDYGVNNTYELGQKIREWLIDFMLSGPIVKIALEGENAINAVRKIVGKTVPLLAEPGTIRGDFATDSPLLANLEKRPIKNLVHASGNSEEAIKELYLWFKESELVQ